MPSCPGLLTPTSMPSPSQKSFSSSGPRSVASLSTMRAPNAVYSRTTVGLAATHGMGHGGVGVEVEVGGHDKAQRVRA